MKILLKFYQTLIVFAAILIAGCTSKPQEKYIKHIFVKCPRNTDGMREHNARQSLAAARSAIIIDAISFEESANEISEDEYSRKNGGIIGWVYQGMPNVPKQVIDTAMVMEKDEISQIIRTDYGFHLLKCDSAKERSINTNK